MKSIFVLRVAVFSFFLAGLTFFSGGNQLMAQTSSTNPDPIFILPVETFVSPAEAIIRLDGALVPIKEELLTMQEGTQEYKLLFAKYTCFNTTQNTIIEGKTVAESIVAGLEAVGTDEYGLTNQVLTGFRQELINLLRI
jgi:hypothetical protein